MAWKPEDGGDGPDRIDEKEYHEKSDAKTGDERDTAPQCKERQPDSLTQRESLNSILEEFPDKIGARDSGACSLSPSEESVTNEIRDSVRRATGCPVIAQSSTERSSSRLRDRTATRYVGSPKLQELTEEGSFREKVAVILCNLNANGYDAVIEKKTGGLRTTSQQNEILQRGSSQKPDSFHLPGLDGKASAADIVDAKTAWRASPEFWNALGSEAGKQGLGWGGLFGIKTSKEKASVMRDTISGAYRDSRPRGWDPAHIQNRRNWQ